MTDTSQEYDTDTQEEEEVRVAPKRAPKPKPVRVRLHNPDDYTGGNNRTVASFTDPDPAVAEHQAKQYIRQHHPRGREVFLQLSDGAMLHYSADLAAQNGEDAGWIEYSEDEES